MVEILEVEDKRKKARSGRKSKLCIENRLLMALEYIREYRTYFHIGQSYGMSESNSFKVIIRNFFIGKTNSTYYKFA